MKYVLAAAFFLFACSPAPGASPAPAPASSSDVPAYGYTVVASYPHATDAFTEGLIYKDGVIYESTGEKGKSFIRKSDLATGASQQQRNIDEKYFGEGMVIWQDRIYSLTWQDEKGFIWDLATFEPKGEWTYKGEGWALTTDGTRIIMSDGTSELRFLEPVTMKETGRVKVTMNGRAVDKLNELEFIKGEVWANQFESDRILRIDPATGKVTSVVFLGGLLTAEDRAGRQVDVLNGIAYDAAADRIFVTGKNWPKLYEIKLKDPAAPKPN